MNGWRMTIALVGGPLDGIRVQADFNGTLDDVPPYLHLSADTDRYVRSIAPDGGQMHTTEGAYCYEWQVAKDRPTA